MHGLALVYMLKENAYTFGGSMGPILKVDFIGNGDPIIERYIRLIVQINVNSSIKPGGIQIREDNSISWLQFNFKRPI